MNVLFAFFSAAVPIGRVIVRPPFFRTRVLGGFPLPLGPRSIFSSLLCWMSNYMSISGSRYVCVALREVHRPEL